MDASVYSFRKLQGLQSQSENDLLIVSRRLSLTKAYKGRQRSREGEGKERKKSPQLASPILTYKRTDPIAVFPAEKKADAMEYCGLAGCDGKVLGGK